MTTEKETANTLLPAWDYDWYATDPDHTDEGYAPDYAAFAVTAGEEYDFRVNFAQHLTERDRFEIVHRLRASQELLAAVQKAERLLTFLDGSGNNDPAPDRAYVSQVRREFLAIIEAATEVFEMANRVHDSRFKANARLIAAAPELLSTLEKARAYMLGHATELDLIQIDALALAAIKKATAPTPPAADTVDKDHQFIFVTASVNSVRDLLEDGDSYQADEFPTLRRITDAELFEVLRHCHAGGWQCWQDNGEIDLEQLEAAADEQFPKDKPNCPTSHTGEHERAGGRCRFCGQ